MKNKLVAIWNIYDGEELLPYSVGAIKDEVDIRIGVVQYVSNRGEEYVPRFPYSLFDYVIQYEPNLRRPASWNETAKRNAGIEFAKTLDATHYILLDCDEIYHGREFARLKALVYGSAGFSACNMRTYYGSPTKVISPPESYFVPFINKLTRLTSVGSNALYPVVCDPTRTDKRLTNKNALTVFSTFPLHHFSWVRKDIERKFRNSSSDKYSNNARQYAEAVKRGELIHFDGELIDCENLFNIEL